MGLPRPPCVAVAGLVAALLLSSALPAEGLRTGKAQAREGSAECAGREQVQEASFFRRVLRSLGAEAEGAVANKPSHKKHRQLVPEDDSGELTEEEEEDFGTSHHEHLHINTRPGSASSLMLYPDKQSRITEVVNGTYSARWSTMWSHYQEQLTQKLRKAAPALKPLKVLMISPVSNSMRSVDDFEYNMGRLRSNSAGDVFHFALFHYDGDDSMWKQRSWYNEAHGVVMSENRPMCKSAAWLKVDPAMARRYDYIWLMDGDLRMDYFSWDLYRGVLALLDPLVSQPAIVPRGLGERSTDLEELQMVGAYGRMFPIAREVERSESMAPLLSSRVWPVLYKRLTRNDVRSVWYTNTVWDILAQWGALSCGKTGVLVVNAAPVRHINCHDLLRRPNRTGNDCIRGCGHPDRQNCRPFSRKDREYVRDAMQEFCPLPTTEGLLNCSHIKYCRQAVWNGSRIRQWMEEKDSDAIKAYLYQCNYTGVHVGFDASCVQELV